MMTWVVAAGLVIGAPALKGGPKPTDPAGDWVLERAVVNGEAREPPAGAVFRIAPASITARPPDVAEPVAFRPAVGGVGEVDYWPGDPRRLRKGIWAVDGDTLLICEARKGGDRPAEFAAPEGSDRVLWVLKRAKKR